jgi:hypothetical protein
MIKNLCPCGLNSRLRHYHLFCWFDRVKLTCEYKVLYFVGLHIALPQIAGLDLGAEH